MAKRQNLNLDITDNTVSGAEENPAPDIDISNKLKIKTVVGYDVQYKDGKVVISRPIFKEV